MVSMEDFLIDILLIYVSFELMDYEVHLPTQL